MESAATISLFHFQDKKVIEYAESVIQKAVWTHIPNTKVLYISEMIREQCDFTFPGKDMNVV